MTQTIQSAGMWNYLLLMVKENKREFGGVLITQNG